MDDRFLIKCERVCMLFDWRTQPDIIIFLPFFFVFVCFDERTCAYALTRKKANQKIKYLEIICL